jgi:hypothetical protein
VTDIICTVIMLNAGLDHKMVEDITFPKAERYDKNLALIAIGCGLPLFFLFAYLGDPSRGIVASLSAGALTIIISTLWNLKSYITFWFMLALSIFFHMAMIWYFGGYDTHFPGIILAPLLILDFLAWQLIIVIAVRAVRR